MEIDNLIKINKEIMKDLKKEMIEDLHKNIKTKTEILQELDNDVNIIKYKLNPKMIIHLLKEQNDALKTLIEILKDD